MTNTIFNSGKLAVLANEIRDLSFDKRLKCFLALPELNGKKLVFGTSFGAEDQIITDIIWRDKLPISLFTLDTGRLFPSTYDVWNKTVDKYGIQIQSFNPNPEAVSEFVNISGINGFYNGVAERKWCCGIRKLEPLKKAISGADVWITGLRSEQDPERLDHKFLEFDEQFLILKFNPLLDLSWTTVTELLSKREIPYNELHDQGFPSIGCAPCTRAIKPGEPFRSGRWWWEENMPKECGLHHRLNLTEK